MFIIVSGCNIRYSFGIVKGFDEFFFNNVEKIYPGGYRGWLRTA